jgi:hypothetical protein
MRLTARLHQSARARHVLMIPCRRRTFRGFVASVLATAVVAACMVAPAGASAPLSGAVFTTDATCTGVNLNIYGDQGDVYLDGGPSHPGAAGLPDGEY